MKKRKPISRMNEAKFDINFFGYLKNFHRQGGSGIETARLLTFRLDEVIKGIAKEISSEIPFAIVALGGYGRVELCPKSDVDVMFLAERKDRTIELLVSKFFRNLWDRGLNIGHSFRTIDECLALFNGDIESFASILEARFVFGERSFYETFLNRLKKKIFTSDVLHIVKKFIDADSQRKAKYGNSIKLLEPNIKKSAGGLRDLHTLLWIFRLTDLDFWNLPEDYSACAGMLSLMSEKGMITREQFEKVLNAFDFLLRTRIELHFSSEFANDILNFSNRERVARSLGYGESGTKGAESFMRDYYLNAREIFKLNKIFILKFNELSSSKENFEIEKIDDLFSLKGGKWIVLNEERECLSPVEIFRAFYVKKITGAHFDENIQMLILNSLKSVDFSGSEVNSLFVDILKANGNRAETLESMAELDVLGKYIPEFGKLIALVQHSIYHFYTVDAHILTAIRNAENLQTQETLVGEVYRSIERKDVLFLAILFHDIGKAVRFDGHAEIGAEIARKFLKEIGFDRIDDVCFLVKNHLLMEQIAFRRNIHEPELLYSFASNFESVELLDMLYVLTYADLSAVNPNSWTSWKAQLLEELYLNAYPIVERRMTLDEVYDFFSQKFNREIEQVIKALSEKIGDLAVSEHFEKLIENGAYISIFTDEEIEEHINRISASGEAGVDVIFARRQGYTEVTVITRDAPFVLAKICGVLSANDANIFDAHIFTRKDGIVIDRFRVFDYISGAELSQHQCQKIESDMKAVFSGERDVNEMFEKNIAKWKRKNAPKTGGVKVAVEFEETADYTIIDVFAPDTIGFLYRVAKKISELGLNIYFAKIATRVDGIIDSFYVLNLNGNKISDESSRERIRDEILKVINKIN